MITLSLPLPPSANNLFPTSKSGHRYPSAAYVRWRMKALDAMNVQGIKAPVDAIKHDVQANYVLGRPDRRRRDLSNMLKGLEDFIVGFGLLFDDSLIVDFRMRWTDEHPGIARITITPANVGNA